MVRDDTQKLHTATTRGGSKGPIPNAVRVFSCGLYSAEARLSNLQLSPGMRQTLPH